MNPIYLFIPLGLIFITLVIMIIIVIAPSKSELEIFRSNLTAGDSVIIDDGSSTFVAKITSVHDKYIRYIKASGKTSVCGLKCVYPPN